MTATVLWMILGGFTGGALGGLLGIGGGILIMPLLRFVIGMDSAQAVGTCMIAVFFTTLGGSLKHFSLGHIHLRSIAPIIVAGVISTLIFSIFFFYISDKSFWLDAAMGAVFLLVSLRMLWEGASEILRKAPAPKSDGGIQGTTTSKVMIGIAAGILPGMLGIGTGAVLVPSFAFVLGAPIKVAIGSSLACFSLNAFASSVFKLIQGFVQFEVLLPLCAGTLIGSRLGASLNGRFSSPFIKLAFGVFFGCVAYKYLKILGL
ncbi:MAG: sulfite exporter TauE/SafE family protein [Acidobacteria bacterium]|nr:sulfite exporter TauE/SafE family protein [Acidobacteriota bacterium]